MTSETVLEGTAILRVCNYASSRGVDPVPLLVAAGFTPDEASDPDRFHPLHKVLDLYCKTASALREPNLGLIIGRLSHTDEYGLIGFLFRASPTLLDALEALDHYGSALLNGIQAKLTTAADGTHFQWIMGQRSSALDLFTQELIAVTWCTIDRLSPTNLPPIHVRLRQPPAHPELYREVFGIDVTFGADVDEIVLNPEMLSHRNPTGDARIFKHLVDAVETQIQKRRTIAGESIQLLRLANCTVDLNRGVVYRGAEQIHLTTKEQAMLQYFAAKPNQVVTHDDIERDVWRIGRSVVSHAPAVAIRRLRQKIETGNRPVSLITVFGEGWKLVVPTDEPQAG